MPEIKPDNRPFSSLNYASRLKIASESRHRAIEIWSGCDAVALSSLMGPMGDGPEWPSGPSWLALNRGGRACIMSDGLSDPWVEKDRPNNGLGLEVYVEVADLAIPNDTNLDSLSDTWLFPMMAEISHTLATYPKLCDRLRNNETLLMRLNIEHIKDGRGLVGMLLHRPPFEPFRLATPNGGFQLIVATLLTQQEVAFLKGRGEKGRLQLLEALTQVNRAGISLCNRESVALV